ncbi:MAG TPA: MraY family glycosyltransferase [Acidobacteriota bacterium]|nr:MraY family glycosyltransferase [Acidobacteriota bacterium]
MSERLIVSLAVMLCSYIMSTVFVLPVRALAVRLGIMDYPGERKSHSVPVPRMGGLAIFASLLVVVWGSLYWLPYLQSSLLSSRLHESLRAISNYVVLTQKLYALLAGALIVTAIGILDDVRGVRFSPSLKFAGQIAAAALLLPAGIYMDLFSGTPWISMSLSVVWVVGITNSFNLLDNMNGLSSGIALICSGIFLVLVMLRGEFFVALLFSAIIGSTLGFFQFNVGSGWIFMGDTGSLLLGFLLGSLSLVARYVDPKEGSLFPVVAPLIILGLPIFDTISVIIIRLREGRPVFRGDQMHLSHRLVRIGMTMPQAVWFNYLLAFSIAANALLVLNSPLLDSILAVVQVAAMVAMVTILMVTHVRNGNSSSP